MRRKGIGLALLLLAGCAVTPPPGSPSPGPPAPSPAQPGICLDALGFHAAPADRLCLPPAVELTTQYETDRTIIAVGSAADGPAVLAYLEGTLPGLGWTVTGTGATGLTFTWGEWSGSLALGEASWGLAVRAE